MGNHSVRKGQGGLHAALVFCAGGISSLCLGRVSPLRARCLLSRQKFNPRAGFNSYTSPFCALHVPRVPAAICPRAAAGAQRGGCVRPVLLLLLAAAPVTRASSLQRSRYARHVGPGETRCFSVWFWFSVPSKMEQRRFPWVVEATRCVQRGRAGGDSLAAPWGQPQPCSWAALAASSPQNA